MPARFLSCLALTLWSWLPSDPDAVVLSRDLPRFPEACVCRAEARRATAYLADLRECYGWDNVAAHGLAWTLPADEIERLNLLCVALARRWVMWVSLAEAQDDRRPREARAVELRRARVIMGEAAFWAGTPPPPIPAELLREY